MLKYISVDKIVSSLIIFFFYTFTIFFWFYCFFILKLEDEFLLIYFPYGIVVLGILFFGIKIIFGLTLTQIIFYLCLTNYNIELPYDNYFILSLCQLICLPITLLVFAKFNISLGAGKNYILDKTNIYHVLLITFFSTIVLGILFAFSSLFFDNNTDISIFTIGNFIGAVILIVLMKILVNLPTVLKNLIKSS